MRFLLLFSLVLISGCRSEEPQRSPTERRLQIIAQMFNRYTASHQGKTPPNEKAFKEFINAISAAEKSALNITSVDELLISSNDNKPFIIRYGMVASAPGMSSGNQAPGKGPPSGAASGPGGGPGSTLVNRQNLFAAEASGATRYVVFATGQVEQLPESDVLRLLK